MTIVHEVDSYNATGFPATVYSHRVSATIGVTTLRQEEAVASS